MNRSIPAAVLTAFVIVGLSLEAWSQSVEKARRVGNRFGPHPPRIWSSSDWDRRLLKAYVGTAGKKGVT